jgi:hypothetical protein
MPNDHDDLLFVSSRCTYTLQKRGNKDVTLAWYTEGAKLHDVTITSVGGTFDEKGDLAPYSLYNMCVQNRNFDVFISGVQGTNVTFWKPDLKTPLTPTGGVYQIPMTDWISPQEPAPNEANIHYLSFESDTCTFKVETKRKLTSKEMKKPPFPPGPSSPSRRLTSHDTIPDPPASGGEN